MSINEETICPYSILLFEKFDIAIIMYSWNGITMLFLQKTPRLKFVSVKNILIISRNIIYST